MHGIGRWLVLAAFVGIGHAPAFAGQVEQDDERVHGHDEKIILSVLMGGRLLPDSSSFRAESPAAPEISTSHSQAEPNRA